MSDNDIKSIQDEENTESLDTSNFSVLEPENNKIEKEIES
jgi:hypothetical protein